MPGRSPWRLSPTRHCLPAVALLVLSVHTLLACRLGRLPASGYSLLPLTQLYGVEVLGLDLTADVSPEVQDRLKHDLARCAPDSSVAPTSSHTCIRQAGEVPGAQRSGRYGTCRM